MLRLLKNLSFYKWTIVFVCLFVFLQALSDLLLPTLMGNIVDNGVVPGNIPYIWKVGGIMLATTALGVGAAVGASYLASKAAMGFGRDIRRKVFTHVEKFSLQEFGEIGTASLITRTTNDITQVQQVVMMMLRMMVMAPIMFTGGLIMAVSKDAKLSLVILGTIPFLVITVVIIMRKGMPLFRQVQKRLDRLNLVLRENLTGIRVIRAFNREKQEESRLDEANVQLTDVSVRVNKIMAFTMPLMMLLMNMTIVGIIWFGGIRIDGGHMQIGDLMAFIQYVMQIMFALLMASIMFVMIPRATVSARRIQDVLDTEPVLQNKGTKSANVNPGSVKFNHVTFQYPNAEKPILKDIDFTITKGETTAIIGGTGSGKSTLIHLIPRFYEVTEGSLYVNGVNVNEIELHELRSKIGLVPQQVQLFSGTVSENIRYGKTNATDREVIEAAKKAQAHEFIMSMDDGYDTHIEQGGANLSGGQKQRISIARALVKKPDIYIFDDSFSALDYKTDAALRKELQEETKDAAQIIVAQRVSTVMNAEQIIVLDEGEIVGIGKHDELLETNETYQEIVKSQMKGDESA